MELNPSNIIKYPVLVSTDDRKLPLQKRGTLVILSIYVIFIIFCFSKYKELPVSAISDHIYCLCVHEWEICYICEHYIRKKK